MTDRIDGMGSAEVDLREQLRQFSELEVRQQAKALAARLGVPRGDVLALWRQEHKKSTAAASGNGEKSIAGRAIGELLRPADPWPDPVDGATWLEEATHELRRYLAMPDGAHVALAAWTLYTHVYIRFGYAPYLIFTSPAPECGKTTGLRLCSRLASLPLFTGSMTTATLFRIVDEHHPVLLCDEQDGRLERNEELRLLFNEGFQKGSFVLRCCGDDLEPRGFDCFGPKAIASIGSLPKTVESRSLVIPMERSRTPLAELGPLDQPEALDRLRRQAARWALDDGEQLGAIPVVPGFDARLRDKAGPLLAVAASAGSGWLGRVATAVQAIASGEGEDAEHLVLLADVGGFVAGCGWPTFIPTESILRALNAMPDAPWSELGKTGITGHKLGALLRHFHLRPEDEAVRNGAERRRGYRTAPIRRAWETYCVSTDDTERTDPRGGYPRKLRDDALGDELPEQDELEL